MERVGGTEADRYTAPSGLASAIGESAARHGIDIGPICRAIGLDPASFSDVLGRISLDRLCRLLETCALIANDETFGLRTVECFKPGSTGPYGYGLITAPTAFDFFQFIGDHQAYVSDKSHPRFTVNDRGAEVGFSYPSLIVKRDQYVDMGMGLLMQRLRSILGSNIDMVEVVLERPKPKNTALYREKLSRKISFGGSANSLRLPVSLYHVQNPRGDERLFRLMDIQCRSLGESKPGDANFVNDLREFILTRVTSKNITLAEIADHFGISERMMQRRLADAGTNLHDLRDDVRRSLAERLLSETDLTAAAIADRLGYSASSAFTRSTMRWFGKTPRDFRKAVL